MSWPEAPFIDVCDIQGGTQPPKSEFIHEPRGGYVRLLQIQDFNNDNKAVYVPDKKNLKKCKEEDILIGRYGASIGRILSGKAGAYNVAIVKTKPNPKLLNNKYLYHYLNSNRFQNYILSVGSRAAQAGFNKGDLERLMIPLPSLPEQKRIAAILDKADAIRRKRRKAIQLADKFLRSVFLDMFGDPVLNPKGWKEARLDQISEIVSGVTKGRKLNGKATVLVPYLRVANVQDGRILIDDVQKIEVLESEVEKYRLKRGDILLTEGGDPDKLGRGAVWKGEIDPCIHQNHIFRVRTNKKIVLPECLSALIGSQRGKRYFLKAAKQTTGVASINKTQLSGFPALVPPIDIQDEYLNRLEKFNYMVDIQMNNYKESGKLFNSLVQRAFRGEL